MQSRDQHLWANGRAFSLIIALVLLVSALVTPSVSALSSTPLATSDKEDLTIVNSTPVIVGSTAISIAFTTSATEGTVHIDLIRPTNTRSRLYDFTQDPEDARVRDSVSFDLSAFTYNESTNTYSGDILTNADPDSSLSFALTGIYPLALSIEQASARVTPMQYSYVTYIPNVGDNGAAFSQRLGFSPVITFDPLVNRLALDDDGDSLSAQGEETRKKFIRARNALAGLNTLATPSNILISPEALETSDIIDSLADDDEKIGNFLPESPNPSIQYISDTYVPTNFAELEKSNALASSDFLFSKSQSILASHNFTATNNSLVTQAITPNVVSNITERDINQVVVRDTSFPSNARPTFRPVRIEQDNDTVQLGVLNTSIMENLPTSFSESAQANFLIAALGVVALESPSIPRGFLMELSLSQLSARTVALVMNAVNNPLTQPITLDSFFETYPYDKTMSNKINRTNFPSSVNVPYTQSELETIAQNARATQSMYEEGSLQSSQAVWMNSVTYSPRDRDTNKIVNEDSSLAFLRQVLDYIALPEKRTLTLTSRENSIPVTVRNTSGIPISIVIEMSSDRLDFPEGKRFPLELTEENNTVQIPIRARTTGSFQVGVSIVTPLESIEITKDTITVRSTVFSGAGLAIAALSLLFLAVWWISHYKKSRKKPLARVVPLGTEKQE